MDNVKELSQSKRLNKLFLLFMLLVLVFLTFYLTNKFKLSDYFPIKKVFIVGVHYSDKEEIKNLVYPLIIKGFFGTNVEKIRERLLLLPWASSIFVRRTWPDTIEINFKEKDVIAKWGDNLFLTQAGEIFSANTSVPDLPLFLGPQGKQMAMLWHFKKINRILNPINAKIVSLELTPYAVWKIGLNNGAMLKIGNKDLLTRLDRFVKVYPKIAHFSDHKLDYIDLRYPNGMAVRFKDKFNL